MQKNVLAFDFGASSGRAIVGRYNNGTFELEEVHRFSNYPINKNDGLYWDFDNLFQQIIIGIKKATSKYSIDSLGIDTWGVDFGLLDENGELLANPRSYRDSRTTGIFEEAQKYVDLKTIYQHTGNQLMEINSLFQLLAIRKQEPELFNKAKKMLFVSDLMNYYLTGKQKAERSIASTSQLVNPKTKNWDDTLLDAFQFDKAIFPTLEDSGSFLGKTKESLGTPAIDVYNVCQHDTASAVVSVPSDNKFLFISCGTWSLVGTELTDPIINEKAFNYNLTNESGYNNTTRFLKNCTGLWIIQELKRNFEEAGRKHSFGEIASLAEKATAFKCLIDTDAPVFATPGNMIERIQNYAKETNQEIPETDGELARCVYESLAMKYKYTLLEICDATETEFDSINIVGGGSQAEILCQMVADSSNLVVDAGPVEATAIGNIAVQLLAAGVFKDITETRMWIKKEFKVKQYLPTSQYFDWEAQFSRYQKILDRSEM